MSDGAARPEDYLSGDPPPWGWMRVLGHTSGVAHGVPNVWPIALGVWALLVLLALWATR